ncbi:MAG: alkaline phosphatase family protein [Solirubrobacterales bacterium]
MNAVTAHACRMRLRTVVLAGVIAVAAAAPATAATERPIVYDVVIDGLDGDRVDAGKAPFISSLLAGNGASSTYYRESRSIMLSETNPNHTAMMTGAYADRSGIPGNSFAIFAPLAGDDTCVRTGPIDESQAPSEVSGENETCPQVETVFAAVKRQGNPDDVRTAAVFGKPKLGQIFSATNGYGAERGFHVDHLWAPCDDSRSDDDSYCGRVATNPVTGYADSDKTVMDEVIRTVREGVPPSDGGPARRPDFTFVNLHQVDSAGHATGTGSAYDTAIAQADDEIKRLVGELRSRGEWERTVLIINSDHSMTTTPSKVSTEQIFDGVGIDSDAYTLVDNGESELVYLNDRTDPGRFELLRRMRAAAEADPQVAEGLYREPNPADGGEANTLDGKHPGWNAASPRIGDLVLTAVPGSAFDEGATSNPGGGVGNPIPGNHGGPQTRDSTFAVIGGSPLVRQQDRTGVRKPDNDDTLDNPTQAENVDVASTVLGLFGLFPTTDNAGRYLAESIDLEALPGGGKPTEPPATRVIRGDRVPDQGDPDGPKRRIRYRVSWQPIGGLYDFQIERDGRFKSVYRSSRLTSNAYRLLPGRTYKFRLRSKAASGRHSDWTPVTIRAGETASSSRY